MCVGRLCPGCRELHTGELHTRVQQARQVEAEVFLAATSWAGGAEGRPGQRSPSPWAGGAARPVELVRMRLVAALDARVYADGVHDRRAGCAVEPMRMEKIRCRSFLFF
jgi:hypothetical protein